jgi:hypothetical protein
MAYFKVFDYWHHSIIAYADTWQHAIYGHPELIGKEGIVMTSLVTPIELQQSDTAKSTHLYIGPAIAQGIYLGEYPVSVVRLEGVPTTGRVWVTGYFTSLLPPGKVLWTKRDLDK